MARKKIYKRRWRGFTEREVSERMGMIAANRFKSKEDAAAHARAMVEARGEWKEIDGKKIYVKHAK